MEHLLAVRRKIGEPSKHYLSGSNKTESWITVKTPTSSSDGRWEKQCSSCGYTIDSVTVPNTNSQTIVTNYEQLRNALAKGGKQWITLKFSGYKNIYSQEDVKSNYTLCVDDPEADITINLNNCVLERTTLYDKALFEVKNGSLRIIQATEKNVNKSSMYNLMFKSGYENRAVFNVEEGGKLRVSNILTMASGDSYAYHYPSIKSTGSVRIDGGTFLSSISTSGGFKLTECAPVQISGGTLTVNGGDFDCSSCCISTIGNKSKNITINNGYFGAYTTGLYLNEYSETVINNGYFFKTNSSGNYIDDHGVMLEKGALTVNDGIFRGVASGIQVTSPEQLQINNGTFSLEKGSTSSRNKCAALVLFNAYSNNTLIKGGSYSGKTGISFYSILNNDIYQKQVKLCDYIPDYCTATDYDESGNTITINKTSLSSSFGTNYLEINNTAPLPVITTQPQSANIGVMGDSVSLNIDASNANQYIWHILDENGDEITWSFISNNGYGTLSTHNYGKQLFIRNLNDWWNGKEIYCEVIGNGGKVNSQIVELKVDKVIKYVNDIYFENWDNIWNNKTVGEYKNAKVSENAPYTVKNVSWSMYGKNLVDSYKFAIGDNVSVGVEIVPKDGYTFKSSQYGLYGKIQGEDAKLIHTSNDRYIFMIDKTITVPDEYKTKDIDLKVDAPTIGAVPSKTASCISGYANIESVKWSPSDTKFSAGKAYTVKIQVTPKYEWGDKDSAVVTVNGQKAKLIAEGDNYYVTYTFPALEGMVVGDADGDGKITIMDATLIQKYLAGLVDEGSLNLAACDTDHNGTVDIVDTTNIQKHLATLIVLG